jgi:hypothetical protein
MEPPNLFEIMMQIGWVIIGLLVVILAVTQPLFRLAALLLAWVLSTVMGWILLWRVWPDQAGAATRTRAAIRANAEDSRGAVRPDRVAIGMTAHRSGTAGLR